MKKIFSIFFPAIILLVLYILTSPKRTTEHDKLIVYTYSSFASSWGAGPAIQKAFLEQKKMNVEFVDVGDGGTILTRLKVEKEKTPADIILGLDQFSVELNKELFKEIELKDVNFEKKVVDSIVDKKFVAYNWAPMNFIYRTTELKKTPKKLFDLLDPTYKKQIIIYDPRSSTPGYIFIHFVLDLLGEDSARFFLKKLKGNISTVAPSWSAGYGIFTQKNAKLAWSYATSPIYHWEEEKNETYKALQLEEGAPVHVEYVAVSKNTQKTEMAIEFVNFLLQPDVQKIISEKNYMLPVIEEVSLSDYFKKASRENIYNISRKYKREDVLNFWESLDVK